MTISLDTEIVGTRYDPPTGDCFYTIERGGKRWTVRVHEDQLHQYGAIQASKQQRRDHLARALEDAMRGPSDEQKPLALPGEAQQTLAIIPQASTLVAFYFGDHMTWKSHWAEGAQAVAKEMGCTLAEHPNGQMIFIWPDGGHSEPVDLAEALRCADEADRLAADAVRKVIAAVAPQEKTDA